MSLSITLIVLAYRQEAFIERAVESAFAQVYDGPLEILLSDDHSPDSTWDIMRSLARSYAGAHDVRLNRMGDNVGMIGHFTAAVRQARGDIITYLAGDDIAAPNRVAQCAKVLSSDPALSFVESSYQSFSAAPPPFAEGRDGHVTFSLEDYLSGRAPNLSSSTRSFRRDLFLDYPDLDVALSSEDSPSALRLLMRGNGARIHRPLLLKRAHATNITGPAGLRKVDFERIGSQYQDDAEFALSMGFVTDARFRLINEWRPRNIQRRKLRLYFDLGYPSSDQMWQEILFSKALRPREKLYAIRRWVRGAFAGRRKS